MESPASTWSHISSLSVSFYSPPLLPSSPPSSSSPPSKSPSSFDAQAGALISSRKPLPHIEPTVAPRQRLIKIDEELPLIAVVLRRPFPTARLQAKPSVFHPSAGKELARLETRSCQGCRHLPGRARGMRALGEPSVDGAGLQSVPTARHLLQGDIRTPDKDTG